MPSRSRLLPLLLMSATLTTAVRSAPNYPPARKSDQVDVLHGVTVRDPYRWLEDPDSPESRAWIEAQNKVTDAYLDKIPGRERLRKRLTKLWNYERFSLPIRRGSRVFYNRNDGLQNQSVLYVAEGLNDKGRILLDPNTLSEKG